MRSIFQQTLISITHIHLHFNITFQKKSLIKHLLNIDRKKEISNQYTFEVFFKTVMYTAVYMYCSERKKREIESAIDHFYDDIKSICETLTI